jgi:hypothetical protein
VGVSGQTLLALALTGFAGQDMAVARLFKLQAAAAGGFEALGRAPVRFHFRHGLSSVQQYFLFKKGLQISVLSKGNTTGKRGKALDIKFLLYNSHQ